MDILLNILRAEELNQNVDNAVNQQVTSECLRSPVIVREILEHISNPELLKLSVVSKLWNHEARSVLRKRGSLTAHLKCDEGHSCQQDVAAFVVDLGRMNVVPFTGISIQICHWNTDGLCPTGDFDLTRLGILNRLSLKHASVELLGNWWEYTHCPGFMVAKQVLQLFSEVFEQLSLNIWGWEEREDFFEKILQNCTLPHLKVLKLGEQVATTDETYTSYIKQLVSRAPNLQEVHINKKITLMGNVLEDRSSVLLVPEYVLCAPFDQISGKTMSALRLESLQLVHTGPEFNFERFIRITPALLQTSCTKTLRRMCVDAPLAVPLMHFGICLENVTYLIFVIDYNQLELNEPRILRIVKNFDFSRLLPSLNRVKVNSGNLHHELPTDVSTFIEQAEAPLSEPKPDRAVNIKFLALENSLLNVASQFLTEMFPSIETLVLEARDHGEISFGSICEHWFDLENLQVKLRRAPRNLDSFFCGIFPEEVEELRQKDEEYLSKVNIVPVMPAITCLKNLWTFKLNLGSCDRATTFTSSKLSGLIAFKRCRNLDISLATHQSSVYQGLSHMKPYVSIYYHVG